MSTILGKEQMTEEDIKLRSIARYKQEPCMTPVQEAAALLQQSEMLMIQKMQKA